MKFKELLKDKRKELGESQGEFGKRFGVSHAAVSDWEAGKSDMPNAVIEFILTHIKVPCELCEGKGYIIKEVYFINSLSNKT